MEDGMSEGELDGLRRAVERLMDGQREALEVLRRALDGEARAEEARASSRTSSRAPSTARRAILGTEEEGDEA